jgi:Methyltransferase domain
MQLFGLDHEVRAIVGEPLFPGTLNVILKKPIRLRDDVGVFFDGDRRTLWPAVLNDVDVWIYRWRKAPLHVVEIVAPQSLRERFCLNDGDPVSLKLDLTQIAEVSIFSRIVWAAIWKWRESWSYHKDGYSDLTLPVCLEFGTAQQQPLMERPFFTAFWAMKQILKHVPVIGSLATRIKTSLNRIPAVETFQFVRLDTNTLEPRERAFRKIRNVLEYTKLSGSVYSAKDFPAGYHTIDIEGQKVCGQRDPSRRLDLVPLDFSEKTVLDLGCNQGGMLLHLRDKLRWAVGVDFDSRMVNAANRMKAATNSSDLSFYVFDLESEPLELIRDFLPDEKADICFLLSVCMWLKNWQTVFDFGCANSSAMLFETNGSHDQQDAQIAHMRSRYRSVKTLAETSEDDPGQKLRKLFYLTEPIRF